ncbi:hypothetical protein ES705_17544 [subsurface metagenome]
MRLFTGLSYEEEMYKLEILCYVLESGEVDEMIPMLEEKGFILTNIDSDSLAGEVILEHYRDIVKVRKELSEQSFRWSRDAKRIKLSAEPDDSKHKLARKLKDKVIAGRLKE